MTNQFYLGLDGGQTSTRAVLADMSGHVLAVGSGPQCDHILGIHGYERNATAIQHAMLEAVRLAGVSAADIASIGMGLTSNPPELQVTHLFDQIVREIATPDHLWISHDAATNLAGASGGQPGVMVIAGSGSISYGINANGKEGKAGGLGYLMGDEGSAWWIGIHALRAAAAAEDGRGQETRLLDYVLRHFEIPTIRHIHGVLYTDTFTRPVVSDIAVDVARLAIEDDVARSIMHRAGELLAIMVVATIRQIHEPGEHVDVYPTGGVFQAGELVLAPFRQVLESSWPEASMRKPLLEPMYGALIRSYQAAGVDVTPTILDNLAAI